MSIKSGIKGRQLKSDTILTTQHPKAHSNPHDHLIDWDTLDDHPEFSEQINCFNGNIQGFKVYIKNCIKMLHKILYLDDFEKFKT